MACFSDFYIQQELRSATWYIKPSLSHQQNQIIAQRLQKVYILRAAS